METRTAAIPTEQQRTGLKNGQLSGPGARPPGYRSQEISWLAFPKILNEYVLIG